MRDLLFKFIIWQGLVAGNDISYRLVDFLFTLLYAQRKGEYEMETRIRVLRCGYNVRERDELYIDRPHGTDDFIFILLLTKMEVSIRGKSYIAEPGSVLIFTPGCRATISGVDGFYNSYVHFDGRSVMELAGQFGLPLDTLVKPRAFELLNELIRRLEIVMILKQSFWEYEAESIMQELLVTMARSLEYGAGTTGLQDDVRLAFHKARIAIHTDLGRQWTVQEMAGLTGFGKTRFVYYYEMFFGVSPKNDLVNARLEHAMYQLSNKALTIRQVADLAGFENTCHFIRSFKRKYGASPSNFNYK
jgi:AraC family transcriptional regulator of arabinose operon